MDVITELADRLLARQRRGEEWGLEFATEYGALTDEEQEAARLITSKSHMLVKPKAEIEKRGKKTKKDEDKNKDSKPNGTERKNLRKTQLTADDLRCRFETISLSEAGPIYEAAQEGRTIIVRWNVDHPFYERFVGADTDHDLVTAIDYFIWAWASAELMVYEDGKIAEMLDQMKGLIAMNTRTLLK